MPICEGCGFTYDEGSNFCPQCARPAPKPRKPEVVTVQVVESIPFNACPVCHKNDRIEKAAVIYQSGHHDLTSQVPVTEVDTDREGRTYSVTRFREVKGTQESVLAQMFHPPVEPIAPKAPSKTIIIILAVAVIVFFIGMLVEPNSTAGGIFLICAILLLFFSISYPKAKRNYDAEMKTFQTRMDRWKRASKNWVKLYFCHRDGIVFFPGRNDYSIPENMEEFISTKDPAEL